MLNKHISSCTNPHCSVPMCRSTRQQQQLYPPTTAAAYGSTAAQFQFVGNHHSAPAVETEMDSASRSDHAVSMSSRAQLPPRPDLRLVGRSSSFSAADIHAQGQGLEDNGFMSMSAVISSKGVAPLFSSLTRAKLRARAEEIVNRLDREEPLLSDVAMQPQQQPLSLMTQQNQQPPVAPPNTLPTHGPMSLPSNDSASNSASNSTSYHSQMVGGSGGSSGQQSMLSPIAESPGNEDTSLSCQSVPPLSHNNSQPQFSSFGSTGLRSAEFDGPGQNSMATADSTQVNSLKEQAGAVHVYPKQKLLHGLRPVS